MEQQVAPQIVKLYEKIKTKHHTPNLISQKDRAVGHSICIGLPGYGKTTGNRKEIELRWELNHKIFCLYDAGRMDMAYFMFPSDSPFWRKPKYDGGKIIGARKYPVELLYPVSKRLPKRLPKNARVFTIPVNDLDENDISSLTGSSSLENIKSIINSMENKVKKNTTPIDYLNMLGKAIRKSEDTDGIKMSHYGSKSLKGKVFVPLMNEGLISSRNAETALDIPALIRDRKTISVLVLRHCPQKLWGFIVHYFMNHVFKNLSGIDGEKRIKMNATITLNEVSDLLATGIESGESSLAISRSIERIAKQYRSANLYLLMDTQLPQQLPDIKDIIHRLYIFNSGFTEVNKALEIMGVTTRTGMITQDEISIIPFLPRGEYFLISKTSGVSFHKLAWLRSRTYNDGEDFYDVYDRVYGKMDYINIEEHLNNLKEENRKSAELWEKAKQIQKKMIAEKIPIPIQSLNKIKEVKIVDAEEKPKENELSNDELLKMAEAGII